MTTYQEVLNYLFTQLPMFQKVGGIAYKKDLDRIRTITNLLGKPQDKFPSIHIAGTNGKGSVSHALASMLQAAGLKVGLYTSPHYIDFRERVLINGEKVPESFVIDFVNNNLVAFEDIKPSFFEWSVALAFEYFSFESVDIAIIETGLGGRLDSTNIINPVLSVITHVDFDHMDYLGDTLPKIATEKAGIIKAKTPVIIGRKDKKYDFVFVDKANEVQAPIQFTSDYIKLLNSQEDLSTCTIEYEFEGKPIYIKTDLTGHFQIENIQTAIFVAYKLNEMGVIDDWKEHLFALENVRKNTNMWGRWQVIKGEPPVILDGAHNEEAFSNVMEQFLSIEAERRHIVMGVSKDKRIEELTPFLPDTAHYYYCAADIPRAMPAEELRQNLLEKGFRGKAYPSVWKAYQAAIKQANHFDAVLVVGSIFVVGELLEHLKK